MSVTVINRIQGEARRLRGSARNVLEILADEADENGFCSMRLDRLADKAGVCRRQVQVVLSRMQRMGLILKDNERNFGRSHTRQFFICCGMTEEAARRAQNVLFRDHPEEAAHASEVRLFGATINGKHAARRKTSGTNQPAPAGCAKKGEERFTLSETRMNQSSPFSFEINEKGESNNILSFNTTINKKELNKLIVIKGEIRFTLCEERVNNDSPFSEEETVDEPNQAKRSEITEQLSKAGIAGPKLTQLAKRTDLTAAIIEAFETDLKDRYGGNYRPGALIRALEGHTPGGYVPGLEAVRPAAVVYGHDEDENAEDEIATPEWFAAFHERLDLLIKCGVEPVRAEVPALSEHMTTEIIRGYVRYMEQRDGPGYDRSVLLDMLMRHQPGDDVPVFEARPYLAAADLL